MFLIKYDDQLIRTISYRALCMQIFIYNYLYFIVL